MTITLRTSRLDGRTIIHIKWRRATGTGPGSRLTPNTGEPAARVLPTLWPVSSDTARTRGSWSRMRVTATAGTNGGATSLSYP